MNQWKVIWDAYHYNATLFALFCDIFTQGNKLDRVLIFLSLLAFLVGITLVFTSNLFYAVWIVVIANTYLVFRLPKLKESLILNQFGSISDEVEPHDDESHRESRYLMFKQKLREMHINKSHIKDCFELVETQLEMAESSVLPLKRFASFVSGIALGFATVVWRNLDTAQLIYVGITLVLVCIFLLLFFYILPSKREKIIEMKYFMQLYCRELK